MSEKDKKTQLILGDLKALNDQLVLKGIELARTEGNIKLLPEVINLMLNHSNPKVVEEAKKLVFDTKVEAGLEIIIQTLRSSENHNHQALLTAALWEAGFNCEDYVEELVEVAIKSNFQTLLEVYTVIDNLETDLPHEVVADLNLSINEWIEENPESEKIALLQTLCFRLNELSGN